MKKIYKVKINGNLYEVELEEVKEVDGKVEAETKEPKVKEKPISIASKKIEAPMSGIISEIKVNPGEKVEKGKVVAILEAMKMETEIFSPVDGIVGDIYKEKGSEVNLGDIILTLG